MEIFPSIAEHRVPEMYEMSHVSIPFGSNMGVGCHLILILQHNTLLIRGYKLAEWPRTMQTRSLSSILGMGDATPIT